MGVSPRYVVRVAGLAVALGLSTFGGAAVALADDGTGAPAPGPGSAEGTSVDDGAGLPAKTSEGKTTLGNGRMVGDATLFSGTGQAMSGIGTMPTSSFDAAAKQAEADEIRDMTHLVQSARDSDEYQEQMFDLIAEMRSQIAEISANAPTERLAPRGE
jgi:hypothetical protein